MLKNEVEHPDTSRDLLGPGWIAAIGFSGHGMRLQHIFCHRESGRTVAFGASRETSVPTTVRDGVVYILYMAKRAYCITRFCHAEE
jgi:hypothetical protein